MAVETGLPNYKSGLTSFCLDTTGNTSPDACKVVYVGQKLAAGTANNAELVKVRSFKEAIALFGAGSVLAIAAELYFINAPVGTDTVELYALPYTDAVGSVKAEHTVTVTGPATETEVLNFRINQTLYAISVVATDTESVIAAAVAAKVNADTMSPFVASAAAGVVTFIAKNSGTFGNTFVFNAVPFVGAKIPAGVTIAIAHPVVGVGDPDISSTFAAAMGACCYSCIADLTLLDANHNAIVSYLDTTGGTWSCGKSQCFGHSFHSIQDTVGNMTTYLEARNSAERNIAVVPKGYHIAPALISSVWAVRQCLSACQDPSRPVQYDNGYLLGLEDNGSCSNVFSTEDAEILAAAGGAIFGVSNTRNTLRSTLWIETNITNYKYDSQGRNDRTWHRTETRYQVAYFIAALREFYKENFQSVALGNNGTRFRAGVKAVNPLIIEARIRAWLRQQIGFVIDEDQDLSGVITVSRNTDDRPCGVGNPERVDVLLNLDFMNQLAHIATLVAVRLQKCA